MHWRGDTRHWHATIEKILADEPASANDQAMKLQQFQLALFERDFIAADRIVAAAPPDQQWLDGFSRDFWMGVVARAKGDSRLPRPPLRPRVQSRKQRSAHGHASMLRPRSLLGGRRRWTRAKRRSAARRPAGSRTRAHRKRLDGRSAGCIPPGMDLRVDWRTRPGHRATRNSFENPNGPTYGMLRLDPVWDSLRGDPRFEKIVSSLAPK